MISFPVWLKRFQMVEDDDLALSKLALVATTRNAILYLLACSEERVSKEVGRDAQSSGTTQQDDQKGDDGGFSPKGAALDHAGNLVSPHEAEVSTDHCIPPP
jgi:hypothetical protein